MNKKIAPEAIEVGVVGLGLMGSSIVVALLLAGHRVKAIAPIPDDLNLIESRIHDQLEHCRKSGLLKTDMQYYRSRLEISEDYRQLKDCDIIFECVIEDIQIKALVYTKIAREIRKDAVIATNTSSIPISILQLSVPCPERFIGIHWAEPAYVTRFMEITCGTETCLDYAEWIFRIAGYWGKEPTLLRKDIRGFITNRLMYAVYRELFHLVGNGKTTIEDADKAFRYDVGSWITLMGLFRRMDFMGLKDYYEIYKDIFPTLCNDNRVPPRMQEIVASNLRGIQNCEGLYTYTPDEARAWEKAFAEFNKDIYRLASLYPWPKIRSIKEPII